MLKIQSTFVVLLVGITVLWLMAEGYPTTTLPQIFSWDGVLYYSGVIAVVSMSFGIILSARLNFLEPLLGGLDKMYRLHKWLGISALVFSLVHWISKQAPQWISPTLETAPTARPPLPEQTSVILSYFQDLRGAAEDVGEPALIVMILLIILALVKSFPYRYFFLTHRVLTVVYLVLVFHSLVLFKFSYWGQVIGPVLGLLMFIGTMVALSSLFRLTGTHKRAVGKVINLNTHKEIRVVRVDIKLSSAWKGHKAGQFAFVTFNSKEGAHPFTITSSWTGDGCISFLIKDLGDYTSSLATTLKVGDAVTIEGPYGEFNFSSPKKRQIWIGGGIGIAAFVARMNTLAATPDDKIVDLFHTTKDIDHAALAALKRDANASGATLHLLIDSIDGFLDVERICAAVPDWKNADIWFCGPVAFGHALKRGFEAKGLASHDFHTELFNIR